jgi:hypothetical protein
MHERALSPLRNGGIEVRNGTARAAHVAGARIIIVHDAAQGGLSVAAETIRH